MKKAPAKKAPAKMTMKKSSVKKAQNGTKIDPNKISPKALAAFVKKSTEDVYGKEALPADVNNRIRNQRERQIQAEKEKKMKQEGGREAIKFMKEKGMGPFKQKNGGRTKK